MRLEGRVAIVTGGGHGIGRHYCLGLAKEGAEVVVAEIDGKAAEAVAQEIASEGRKALGVRTDVADEASTLQMARQAMERFGRIDILVNNAAIFATIPMSRVPFEQVPVEEWDRLMAVNLKGLFLCSRAVVPHMKARGKGKIVNISSGTAFHGGGGRIHYVTSKAGVIGFTRTLARELGQYSICVNAIAPGSTLSEAEPTPEVLRMRDEAASGRCFKRTQRPADLVGTVVFLCSDDSDFVTGQTLVVDGGSVMH